MLDKTESPWVDTNLLSNSQEGPVVIKLLKKIKTDQEFEQLQAKMRRVNDSFDTEKHHPNLLMYFSETPARVEKTTRLLRQYVCYNLSEKIHWLPHLLTKIEKKWLIFQLLCGLSQIHSAALCHGDLKPENILVTSYDWLFIADFSPYKPTHIKDDDLKAYNEYFGDLDNNIRCYTAPERWKSPNDSFAAGAKLEPSMDIFSAGCIIAEIMMDGLPLFDLARLQNHRRGTFDPREELQKRIGDPIIVKLILQMIDRSPTKRPEISKCMDDWNELVFPQSFSKVLFHLGAAFQRVSHLYSDNKISLIRYHLNSIYETTKGTYNIAAELKEPTEPSIYNLLRSCDTVNLFNQLEPVNFQFHNQSRSADEMQAILKVTNEQDQESLLLVVLWLSKLFPSAFHPQSKLLALEMIEKMSHELPFQLRLNLILPLLMQGLGSDVPTDVQVKCSSTTKIRTKTLEVILGIFPELENGTTDEITIEPLDYKVASSYIIYNIKYQLDSSKDPLIRLVIAQNLGRLAKLAVRLLEISISSAARRRQEHIESKQAANVHQFFSASQANQFGAHRSTIVSKREDFQIQDAPEANDEDQSIPDFDSQLQDIWTEVTFFIHHICEGGSIAVMTAMLDSFIQLSQIFGVEESDYLVQQCLSCLNNLKDFKVKIQVLKTMSGMANRLGVKKVDELVLPLTEQLLEDSDDLVILQNIKMINFLTEKRLIYKWKTNKLLDQLLPLCLYPNLQIRMAVSQFIFLLTPKKQGAKPLIEFDDFYCFVRPKLITFVKEYYQMDIMNFLESPQQILEKFRDPLSLKVMRAYFNLFSKMDDKANFSIMEEQFTSRYCTVNLTDNDHFAFAALSSIFRAKLKKIKNDEKQEIQLQMQGKHSDQLYRVIRQSAVQKLATGMLVSHAGLQTHDLTEEQKVKIVQFYSEDQERLFMPQKPQLSNYGLNPVTDPTLFLQSIPFEMSSILKSLNVVPNIQETKIFKNIRTREKGDISRYLRVNSELQMATRGAQASLLDQFDYLHSFQKVNVKVLDEHRKEFQNVKEKHQAKDLKPLGTLVTTLYEHNSAVNTVTVSDDQQFFMTGAREDKEIHIWQMKNIQDDNYSHSLHLLETQSKINQIQMLANSTTLAAATEQGVELYDLGRVFQSNTNVPQQNLDFGEILQIQSMQSPITYQNLLVVAKQTGGVLLYDLRSRQCAIRDEQAFKSQGGAVSAMCIGKDAFTMTVGTLGGYVITYDIRYGINSSLYMHHLNWPILAMKTYRKRLQQTTNLSCLISTGGPQHELCSVDLENGQINTLYRIQNQPTGSSTITKAEIPNVPEFFRETKFRDRKFGTLKRDTNLGLFHRSILNTQSTSFATSLTQEGMRNVDQYYMHLSTERFKRINEAFTCQNACRTILLPRNNFQSLMFDNETAGYAITGGNDRKIRYWNLQEPAELSYQVNTPNDDEVLYMKEQNFQRGVNIVVEKPLGQKEFPKYSTARVKDQLSTFEKNTSIKGKNYFVKYEENTSYHNAIASLLQGKVQTQPGKQATPVDWAHVQYQEQQGYLVVSSLSGTSQSQHLNNLAITPDPIEDSTENRISDVVSHQDAILDLAICQDMLISCGRDGLIKIWK